MTRRAAPSPRWWRWRTWWRTSSVPSATEPTVSDLVLDEPDWTDREHRHRARVDGFLAPHVRRRERGEPHPVWDFLFTYYSLRPRQLRRWHPGFGVALGGPAARRYLRASGYGSRPGGVG